MPKIYILLCLLFCIACVKKEKKKSIAANIVTQIIIKDSADLINIGKMQFFSDAPNVKDCFLAINEQFLPIPAAYRLQMLEDYDIRDVLQHPQKLHGDEDSKTYNYEIDNLDSLNDYMMFSIFNDEREMNYFLRYFRDTSENEANAIGLACIDKYKGIKKGSHVFLAQTADTLELIDSLFPKVTMRDFMDETQMNRLHLSEDNIQNPNVLVWVPSKRKKDNTIIGVELCFDAFGDKKTEVKSACRRTKLDVKWEEGEFDKDGLKPIVRTLRKKLSARHKGRKAVTKARQKNIQSRKNRPTAAPKNKKR